MKGVKKKLGKKVETRTPFADDNYEATVTEVVDWIGGGLRVLVTDYPDAKRNGVYKLTARKMRRL